MATVRFTYRGNGIGMIACRQPVEKLGANNPPFRSAIRRCHRPRAAGYYQHQPRAHRPCLVHPAIQPIMRGVQKMIVQIKRVIGSHAAGLELAIPMSIQGRTTDAARQSGG